MQDNAKINALKRKLPLGGMAELSRRTGLAPKTVDNFFKDKTCRISSVRKLVEESEKIITEYNELVGNRRNN